MIVVRSVADLRAAVRAARASGLNIGLVPTMGAFHDGHVTLMHHATARCGFVAVSLFVNPTQFTHAGDLAMYPRDEARDRDLAAAAGVALLFAPGVDEVYPAGFASTVAVQGLSERLEGAVRGPQHFHGVATVVTKLFNMVQPDIAFFGQKDAQQALIIRRLVRDLDIPVEIEICPTVREADGLAMASRNVRLSPAARSLAPTLSRALFAVQAAVRTGERDPARALTIASNLITSAGIDLEYLVAVSAETLDPVRTIDAETLVLVAARLDDVRLIDNILVGAE